MPEIVLACRDCGQIHRASAGLLQHRWLLCCRCGARLWQRTSSEFNLAGNGRSALILNGAVALSEYGDGISVVGMLVAVTSGIIPALGVALIVITLGRLRATARDGTPPGLGLAGIWRLALHLRRWSMLDVYLLGAVVAYTRLGQLGQVGVAAGGYALAALVLVQVLIERLIGRPRVWNAIGKGYRGGCLLGGSWPLLVSSCTPGY